MEKKEANNCAIVCQSQTAEVFSQGSVWKLWSCNERSWSIIFCTIHVVDENVRFDNSITIEHNAHDWQNVVLENL